MMQEEFIPSHIIKVLGLSETLYTSIGVGGIPKGMTVLNETVSK